MQFTLIKQFKDSFSCFFTIEDELCSNLCQASFGFKFVDFIDKVNKN